MSLCTVVKWRTSCITHHACKYATKFWVKNLTKRDTLEDPEVDESTVLKWLLQKWGI